MFYPLVSIHYAFREFLVAEENVIFSDIKRNMLLFLCKGKIYIFNENHSLKVAKKP